MPDTISPPGFSVRWQTLGAEPVGRHLKAEKRLPDFSCTSRQSRVPASPGMAIGPVALAVYAAEPNDLLGRAAFKTSPAPRTGWRSRGGPQALDSA